MNSNDKKIDSLPEDWKTIRLGDLAQIVRGVSYRSENYCSEREGFIFINLKCVGRNGGFRKDGIKYYKGNIKQNQFVSKGDILIANTDLTQNREVIGAPIEVPLLDKKACFSLDLTKLVTNSKIERRFLYYYLLSPSARNFMINNGNGTTVVHLAVSNIPNLLVPLPLLPEQISIAKILSDLDAKIELSQKMGRTLESIAQAIFRHWFIDFEFPNEKGKPYKSSGGEMVDSELGKIPKGWEVGRYSYLVKVTTGKGLKREEVSETGLYPVMGANGELGRTNKFLFDENLILTGRVGTLGKIYITQGKVWITDNVLISKAILKEYFYYSYYTIRRFDFKSLNRGSTQPLITQTDLKAQVCLIPDQRLLILFDRLLSSMFENIYMNLLQNKNLSQIRDALLPRLMSGKIRVPLEDQDAQ